MCARYRRRRSHTGGGQQKRAHTSDRSGRGGTLLACSAATSRKRAGTSDRSGRDGTLHACSAATSTEEGRHECQEWQRRHAARSDRSHLNRRGQALVTGVAAAARCTLATQPPQQKAAHTSDRSGSGGTLHARSHLNRR